MATDLPIAGIRAEFLETLGRAPLVISSPTGSGKSTEVPRWCSAARGGESAPEQRRVLVVEPRRIACRSLALRVAELEATGLGQGVGYVVRDERLLSDATRIVFATPGMVLRDRRLLAQAHTIILDEFHERSLEVDLLLALLLARRAGGADLSALVIMSATLEGERLAAHVGGVHLSAAGVSFPVDVRHVSTHHGAPNADDLPGRLRTALRAAANDPGDVLVFLPGKAEIEACAQSVRDLPFTTLRLHGGLGLDEQRRAFEATPQRKLILATNVAETSLTIPGVGVVIDSGLVRQTRYHAGRGFLALVPIAEDSAAQRAGRAGRTAPGVCYRLWSASARLEKTTLPELQRESLVPLVLGAAAWNVRVEDLPWLDAPKAYALEAARADLSAWRALSPSGELSAEGQALVALPLTPLQARLLTQARAESERCLEDMIDLVSVLSVARPLFSRTSDGEAGTARDDPRACGCDVTATIQTLRADEPPSGVVRFVLDEALRTRKRLRRTLGMPDAVPAPRPIDRDALARAALAADARMAHVARPRGRDLSFSNGGTEIELARESAVRWLSAADPRGAGRAANVEALLVFDTHAIGNGREARVLITCGMAVPLSTLARAGLGSDRIASVKLERNHVLCGVERVYAQRVIAERLETPRGALLREALTTLLARGSLFREAVATTRERLARTALANQLAARSGPRAVAAIAPELSLEEWLLARLTTLGVESEEDLALLSAQDLLAPELPPELSRSLDQDFPSRISIGDASYRAEYDLTRNQVLLHLVQGNRRTPPPLSYLPRFPGLRICVEGPHGVSVLRERA